MIMARAGMTAELAQRVAAVFGVALAADATACRTRGDQLRLGRTWPLACRE